MSRLTTAAESIVEREVARQREFMKPGWESIRVTVNHPQDEKSAVLTLWGHTQADTFFKVWLPLEEIDLLGMGPAAVRSYLESKAANACLTLDTFLDPRCKCVPTPGAYIGEHCPFHKEIYGF